MQSFFGFVKKHHHSDSFFFLGGVVISCFVITSILVAIYSFAPAQGRSRVTMLSPKESSAN